jgi:hypothetical protein
MNAYQDFLAQKAKVREFRAINPCNVHVPVEAFDYQRRIIEWACRMGRAAIFADCGLGKTLMQSAWAMSAQNETGKPTLILAPLSVARQTVRDARRFGIHVAYTRGEVVDAPVVITNYEMLDRVSGMEFGAIVLDESSILKSFDGKTRTALIEYSQRFPFRLACTATPAPNDYIELGNHAEFLGVCSRQEMLSEFFIHETSGTTDAWRLKGHADTQFWAWCARWSVAIRKPSDIGGDDSRHAMPALRVIPHIVEHLGEASEGELFRFTASSLSELRTEMRENMPARVEHAARIVLDEPAEQWIVWCHTNAESESLVKAIPGAVEIRGSEHPDAKAQKIEDFTAGAIRVIVTKPSIAGFGINWQQCARMVWASISHSYEQFYQAARRSWRFGQTRDVHIHAVFADTEQAVWSAIKSKQEAGNHMMDQMAQATRKIGLDMDRVMGANRTDYRHEVKRGERWEAHHGDCVEVFAQVPDESIGMTIFSPPFASLYTYSDSDRDMGNCKDDKEFAEHFKLLIPSLLRATKPGRICAVHCMQLTTTVMRDGHTGMKDFRGAIIQMFVAAGWIYHSEVCIWKDPVTAMQRTKAIGLLHKQLCKDSTVSRQGIADYLCIFRKPGGNPEPVHGPSKDARFDRYVGEEGPTSSPDDDARRYSIDVWQRYASPVWFDINQSRTLQYTAAREEKDERHICPLQLDVIERAIEMWSNPGDLVASPFMGIGSETTTALKMGRRAIGAELKRSYFDIAVKNHELAENPPQTTLF